MDAPVSQNPVTQTGRYRPLCLTLVCPFSAGGCEEPVAGGRRNGPPDGHLEPRPRRCGPLRGANTGCFERTVLRGSDGVLTGFLFDRQVTLLFNDTRVFPPVALASEARQHRLTALTPGRHYKIVVSTFSGPYERAQFIGGQTGEMPPRSRTLI